jgi:hypothetical protein
VAVPGAIGSDGKLLEERGVSPVPGMFYVRREWQNSRASGLLCGVASDSDKLVGSQAVSERVLSAMSRQDRAVHKDHKLYGAALVNEKFFSKTFPNVQRASIRRP